jgi:Spy/CpxP family protein refolding chaperone
MKKNMLKTTGIIVFSFLLVAALNAQPRGGKGQGYGQGPGAGPAWEQGRGYGQGRDLGPGQGFAFLDLTGEQEEQLTALRLEHYKTMKPLRNEMSELRLKKRNLMSEEEVDLKEVHQVIDDQTALSNKMQKLQAEHRLEARSLLTEEQVMKLEQHRDMAKFRRGKGRSGCRGPRG